MKRKSLTAGITVQTTADASVEGDAPAHGRIAERVKHQCYKTLKSSHLVQQLRIGARRAQPANLCLYAAKIAPVMTRVCLRLLAKLPILEHGPVVRQMASVSGCRITVDAKLGNGMPMKVFWLDLVSESIRRNGYFERGTVELLRQLLRPGQVFIDAGAQLGQYTLLAAGLGARVHAFEPNPSTFSMLEQNVHLNQLEVRLNPAALSDESGMVTLYDATVDNIGSASMRRPYNYSGSTHQVRCMTLDQYGVRPDVLKIDTEGAELLVLRGGRQVLSHRPPIILEFSELHQSKFGISCSDLEQYLGSMGYQLSLIGHDGQRLQYRRPGLREFVNVLAS